MSTGNFTQQSQVQSVLTACRRQIRQNAVLSGMATLALVLVGGVLLAAMLDFVFPLPAGVRAVLLGALIVTVCYTAFRHLVRPLQERLTDQQLGAAADLSSPELQESLATLISIEAPSATASEAGSSVMQKHLRSHVAGHIAVTPPADVVDLSQTKRRCGYAGLAICLALIPVVLWPSISRSLMNRLVTPFANLSTVSNLYFEIPDGNRTVARGSDVTILAKPSWRNANANDLPEQVSVVLTTDEGVSDAIPMQYDTTEESFVAVLNAISDSVDYYVTSSEVTTETYRLDVVDRPLVQTAVMTATPPVYTGRAVQNFDGMVGEMKVFEGSQLEISLTFNKPVESATLVWLERRERESVVDEPPPVEIDDLTGEEAILNMDPDAPLESQATDIEALPTKVTGELSDDGLSAEFSFIADYGGNFEFEILDEFELSNLKSTSRSLLVEYDQPPLLKVSGVRDGDRFRPEDILPLNCIAEDDLGLGELELHYQINDQVNRIVPASDFERGSRLAQTGFRLNLDDFELTDGDVVRVKVKAADERPEPGPQETWSDVLSVTIDSEARASGSDSMNEEMTELVDNLRQLEQLLKEDEQQGWKLRDEARRDFNEEQRATVQQLSEKEQQQGRILEKLAEQVATHPLMQDEAKKLQEVSEDLRSDIPEALEKATEEPKRQASKSIEKATQQIQQARNELNRQIRKIEEKARLEQELAELNRLALEAQQLASDAEQLQQDRQQDDAQPPEMNDQEWQEQLQNREAELQQQQQDLSNDIEDLIQQQEELRRAAQNAQKEQLQKLADEVQQLAEQQSEVAQGAQEQAREAGRDARQIAAELEKVRQEADKLNQQMSALPKRPDKADTQTIQQAAQEARKGNLDESRENVASAAEQIQQIKEQLEGRPNQDAASEAGDQASADDQAAPGDSDPQPESSKAQSEGDQSEDAKAQNKSTNSDTASGAEEADRNQGQPAEDPQQAARREEAVAQAADVQEKLESLEQRIAELQEDRNTEPAVNSEPAGDPPGNEPAPAGNEQSEENANTPSSEAANNDTDATNQENVESLLEAIEAASQSANALSEKTQQDPRASGNAQRATREASNRSETAREKAAAGRFSESARELSRASTAANSAASQLNNETQQEQRQEAESLSRELGQLAENLQDLQRDNGSQVAAQQKTQSEVAEQAAALPERIQELQQKLELPSLQMQQQAQKTQEASEAANDAAQTSQQAANQLQEGNLQQASENGRQTANELRQIANAVRQAGQQGGQQQSAVPNEVGESVADALQKLQQAGEAMQGQQQPGSPQAGEQGDMPGEGQGQPGQPGEGQPGEGQPGEGQPGQSQPQGQGQQSPGAPSDSGQALSEAASRLAQAAQQALPGQHQPGMPSQANSPSTSDSGNGSQALWNGLLPGRSGRSGGTRNWGQLNDELDTETSEASRTSRDSQYEALIQMYFQEVAKAQEKSR